MSLSNSQEIATPVSVPPAGLSAAQIKSLADAQNDEFSVQQTGTAFQRTRAIAYFNRHKFVAEVSPRALAYHVEQVMDYKVDGITTGDFQKCAMASSAAVPVRRASNFRTSKKARAASLTLSRDFRGWTGRNLLAPTIPPRRARFPRRSHQSQDTSWGEAKRWLSQTIALAKQARTNSDSCLS